MIGRHHAEQDTGGQHAAVRAIDIAIARPPTRKRP
jgi:hypothetical protein